jgi:solute:Na+ symporter, SSS family
LTIEFAGIRTAVLRFALIHAPLIFLAVMGYVSPQIVAFPAALLTLILFIFYWKKTDGDMPFYKSDVFYAGILTGAMVFIMYYFA